MKLKLSIVILLGTIITIIIYNITQNDKLKLLALGDGVASGMTAYNINGYSYNDYLKDDFKDKNQLQSYNNVFTSQKLTIRELIDNINNNVSKNIGGEHIPIQQAIKDANVLTLAIGMDELTNYSLNKKLTRKVINKYLEDYKELINLIKKINREKIIMLGFYPTYELTDIEYINKELKLIAETNNFEFIDISRIVQNKEYYFNDSSYYLNYKGHKAISDAILKVIWVKNMLKCINFNNLLLISLIFMI